MGRKHTKIWLFSDPEYPAQGGEGLIEAGTVRWMMDVRPLDGKVILRIQDANVTGYSLPGRAPARRHALL